MFIKKNLKYDHKHGMIQSAKVILKKNKKPYRSKQTNKIDIK